MDEEPIDVADSPEVRIARLDEALKNLLNRLETITEAYAPTNKTVIENALKIAELQKDLDDLSRQIPAQIERREEHFRRVESQILACAQSTGELEQRVIQRLGELEQRQRKERETREEDVRKERQTRNRWVIGIVCGFVCTFGGIYLGSVLGGG